MKILMGSEATTIQIIREKGKFFAKKIGRKPGE
jgi:hypothetical protein